MLSPRSGNQLHCSGSTIENQIYLIFCKRAMIWTCLQNKYTFLIFFPFYFFRVDVFAPWEEQIQGQTLKYAGEQAIECVCLIEASRLNDLNVCSFTVRGSGDRILIMKFCDCISLGKLGLIIIIIAGLYFTVCVNGLVKPRSYLACVCVCVFFFIREKESSLLQPVGNFGKCLFRVEAKR